MPLRSVQLGVIPCLDEHVTDGNNPVSEVAVGVLAACAPRKLLNHNRMFFDATLLGLNGIQGPSFVRTGCMFRRVALYSADPPRWRSDDAKEAKASHRPNMFGKSTSFINSMPAAANQERSVPSPATVGEAELADAMTCAYEDGTEWGNDVGWVYNIATEDVVTGFRLHRTGWRSTYCAMEPDAFRGTAPINLTERLYQILRWSGGSLEMFFSRFCPLLAGRRLHPMQRVAYINMTTYPVSTFFILMYYFYPVMWLFQGEFYIQRSFQTFALFVVVVIATVELIGMVEIRWAGLTLLDWVRNEQFYIIGTTGVYPMAMLQILLRSLGIKGVSFKLTAKKLTGGARERLAELDRDLQRVSGELRVALAAEEKSKRAMEELVLALKEVNAELHATRQQLARAQHESETARLESDRLHVSLKRKDDKVRALSDEVARLRSDAEEALATFRGKEAGFTACMKSSEAELAESRRENARLLESARLLTAWSYIT
ncbi:cellulose synthase-like CslF9 [Hordeum vulgare]|nr:cellulose synthase-like CslF9 [Hordeum vulgare]